jgi:hypothetical protein
MAVSFLNFLVIPLICITAVYPFLIKWRNKRRAAKKDPDRLGKSAYLIGKLDLSCNGCIKQPSLCPCADKGAHGGTVQRQHGGSRHQHAKQAYADLNGVADRTAFVVAAVVGYQQGQAKRKEQQADQQ